MNKILLTLALLLAYQAPAFAYLDPGTGSMLLSALVGIVATLFFGIKALYYKLSSGVLSIFGVKIEKNNHSLVFYSEGKNYWKTFKPVLEALDKRGVKAVYLTSSEDDEGLNFKSEVIQSRYIGTGNKAYTYLNMLEADICALTTPGLDVLQIRRSKGVKHYTHIVHAPTDLALYKLYSFDYYDSILCSGEHQKRSIRHYESLRGTDKKQLLDAGCPYMDELKHRLESNTKKRAKNKTPCILIAPTWGENGLLKRFGMQLIQPLIDQGYKIIIRPHPQSFIAEIEMIEALQAQLSQYDSITWDRQPDNFDSLFNSDVMISDLSGVIFDYAFVFEKPVITLDFELNLLGTDANDLPYPMWELTVLDQIGQKLKVEDLDRLPQVIKSLASDKSMKARLASLREESLMNYGQSGEVIAEQLIAQLEQINTK